MPRLSISDKLALELVSILSGHLCENNYSREQFEMQMLLTLSKPLYVNQLLYRDYRVQLQDTVHHIGTERIHDQAITYFYQVLGRRLQLARNLVEKPGNMHRLFASLCQSSRHSESWNEINIRRSLTIVSNSVEEESVKLMADVMARQITLLGESYSPESRRRRMQFGPLWLHIGQDVIEIPEEMSLFDVFDAVPKNLCPKFEETDAIRNIMVRVVKSLNERYMLLRSCGLDIDDWLEESTLSINNLRDIKRLRKSAENYQRTGQIRSPIGAYRHAFDVSKQTQKKVAGCLNFNEFALTKYGAQLMQLYNLQLDDIAQDNTRHENFKPEYLHSNEYSRFEENVILQLDTRRQVKDMLQTYGDEIDEVMKIVFEEAIVGGGLIFQDSQKQSLFDDPDFQKVVNASSEYSALSRCDLVDTLTRNAKKIIELQLLNTRKNYAVQKL